MPALSTSVRSLPRSVWLLGAISLLNDSASEMIYPLLPLFLAGTLGAGPRILGLIEGLAEAVSSLLKLAAGRWSDRMQRAKPFVVVGYGIAGVARTLIAAASGWWMVLLCRLADRVGKGVRSSPRDALLGRSIQPQQRGLAFGLHRAMDNAGAVIGPLVAAGLLALGMDLRTVFWCAGVPALVVLLLTLRLREPEAATVVEPTEFSWRLHGFPPAFKRYLLVLGLFMLGNSSNLFLLLRVRELGFAQAQIPLLWALMSLVAATAADAAVGTLRPRRQAPPDCCRLDRLCRHLPAAGLGRVATVERVGTVRGVRSLHRRYRRGRESADCRSGAARAAWHCIRLVPPDAGHHLVARFDAVRLVVALAVAVRRIRIRRRLRVAGRLAADAVVSRGSGTVDASIGLARCGQRIDPVESVAALAHD